MPATSAGMTPEKWFDFIGTRCKTVMVGDRSHDIAGGRKNGMATLGVLYGYGTMAELLEAGADDYANRQLI